MLSANRMILCAKDIMQLTGKCERTARRMIAQIKKKEGIQQQKHITVEQFCAYTGLREEKLLPMLMER